MGEELKREELEIASKCLGIPPHHLKRLLELRNDVFTREEYLDNRLSPSTFRMIKERGYVVFAGLLRRERGRPPMLLRVNDTLIIARLEKCRDAIEKIIDILRS